MKSVRITEWIEKKNKNKSIKNKIEIVGPFQLALQHKAAEYFEGEKNIHKPE